MVGLLVLLQASGALAGKPAADSKLLQARSLFAVGLKHFEAGEYEEAIVAFQTGYAIKPQPLFLFNIAQAALRAKKLEMAAEYYEKYLAAETALGAQSVADARVQLELTRRALAANAAPKPAPADDEPAPAAAKHADTPALAAGATPLVIASPPPATSARPWWKRGWVWGVVGGVAAAGLGVGLGLGLGMHTHPEGTIDGIRY